MGNAPQIASDNQQDYELDKIVNGENHNSWLKDKSSAQTISSQRNAILNRRRPIENLMSITWIAVDKPEVENLENNNCRLKFKDGSVYLGHQEECLPHGFGELDCPAKQLKGTWKNGYPEGFGVEELPGSFFKGSFKRAKRNGLGKMTFKNGDVYYGNFYEGSFDGFGVYKWLDGVEYKGNFTQGKFDGIGTLTVTLENGKSSYGLRGYWQKGDIKDPEFCIFDKQE